MRALALALVSALAIMLLAAACGGDDEGGETTTTTAAAGECEGVEAPPPRDPETLEQPTDLLDEGTDYSLVFETNCGSFTIALDQETAPNTSASLVALTEGGFFDDTIFHRVVPGFVIQGGDPTATGTGDPGYKTVDVPPADAMYVRGVVAMAKTGAEPPGTAGSQFFVVTGENVGLPAEYAIVGEVSEGLETIALINSLGVGDAAPVQPVVISSATVEED